MKNKIIKIIFLLIALGLFITTIALTNDSVKEVTDTEKWIPMVVISLMILVCIILVHGKRNKL